MRVARWVAGAAVLSVLLGLSPPASAGGGGCRRPPNEGVGTTVRLVQACMAPSVLRVDAGAQVTFVNEDEMPHNIASSTFFEELPQKGDRVQLQFPDSGTYAYVCTLHPGMTGAVVVGDGHFVGADVAVEKVASPAVPVTPIMASRGGGGRDDLPVTGAAAGLALALTAAGYGAGRRSARRARVGQASR